MKTFHFRDKNCRKQTKIRRCLDCSNVQLRRKLSTKQSQNPPRSIMIGSQLRSEFADVSEVVASNLTRVLELYDEAFCKCLNYPQITNDESHDVFCMLVAVCLLYDKHEIEFPLSYDPEDEDLIAEIYSAVDILLMLEAMVNKNIINKKMIDDTYYYSVDEKNDTKNI